MHPSRPAGLGSPQSGDESPIPVVTKSTPISKMFPRRQPSLLRTTGPKGGALGLGPAGAGECASLHFSRIVNVDGGQPAGSLESRKAEAWPCKGRNLITESSQEAWQETGPVGCREEREADEASVRFRFRAVSPLAVMLQSVRRRGRQGRCRGRERVCF